MIFEAIVIDLTHKITNQSYHKIFKNFKVKSTNKKKIEKKNYRREITCPNWNDIILSQRIQNFSFPIKLEPDRNLFCFVRVLVAEVVCNAVNGTTLKIKL